MAGRIRELPGISLLVRLAARVPHAQRLYRSFRGLLDPHRGAVNVAKALQGDVLLQWSGETCEDRYPVCFKALQRALAGTQSPRILSFGCSTGEEVFTLRAYFPGARITGIDINAHAISVAREKLGSRVGETGITFRCAGSLIDEPQGHYDVIIAMAVLRHGELARLRPQSCADIMPFEKVERAVEDLARCLKPGGLLMVGNSHFRVIDMACASQFEVVYSEPQGLSQPEPVYGPDDRLRDDPANCEAIFRKLG